MQNSWIMGDMHLNQVRQIAYQGVGVPPQQQQATFGTVTVQPAMAMVEVVEE